jgi:myo-inositol catabolism protein IolC
MFPVYGEKCFSRKAVHNLVEKFSQGRSKVADQVRKWLRQQSKDFYATCFDTLIKGWDKCWRIWQEISVFSRFEYHMFYVLYPFVSYLLI